MTAVSAQPLEKLMKISAISKFTHLSSSESELNFGEILVGAASTARAPTERELVLRNRSLVRASFQIVNVESDHDPVFFFSPLSGVVEPESTLSVKVRYTPLSAGTFTCDHFHVITPGGNVVRLACKGRAVGPGVSVWKKNNESNFVQTKSVNFQDVAVGKSSSRVLTLRNESPVEVWFHFSCQQRGAFQFDHVNGRIAPFADMNLTITFAPAHAGNFYRRVFLLLHNQSTLFVDVLGTGYDDKTRPSPFQQAHVDAYHLRASAGLALLNPDQLETYWQDNGDELFLQGALRRIKNEERAAEALKRSREQDRSSAGSASPSSRPTPQQNLALPPANQVLTRSGEASLADVEVCHEYFVSMEAKSNAIVVNGALLDFGTCGIVQLPSKKTLQVTNNTHGKITCTWRVSLASSTAPGSRDDTGGKTFQVFPDSADIAAGAMAEFRVAFQPTQTNSYYFAELEGFVAFKSNRTFRLVNVETFAPPWCILSSVCGNTFASPTEQFLSKLAFKKKVHFPPCYLGDSVFQTILVENASDTPALFAFVSDASEIFECKPACGYIAAKSFHLVQIRFTPRKTKMYTHALQCVVNNARSRPETIELAGTCALPAMVLDDESGARSSSSSYAAKVYIKPTSVGLQSVRSVSIANASRVPLVFRWEIPRAHQDVFQVKPKLGRLNGNESVSIECAFSPSEVREYVSRFLVVTKSISYPSRHQLQQQAKIPVLQEETVKVQTKGTTGAIVFDPEALQFETILVNTSARQTFFIVNVADCDLQFELHQRVTAETATSQQSGEAMGKLAFSESQGCIAARSRKKITATFLPRVTAKFTFEVSCVIATSTTRQAQQPSLLPHESWSDAEGVGNIVRTCTILAESSFPTVVIEDIRVSQLPSQLAWCQFQCHELNEYLSAPLSKEEELTASASVGGGSGGSHQQPDHDATADASLRHFDIPFSPAALGSHTEKVFVKLKNPGSLVVQFRLRYPKEGNVEIEHWAETGAPSPEEVRLNAIIDSKVFGISPRKATLLPHQSVLLALSYSYASDAYGGSHDLPIYLEVDKGKRVVLELHGRTLACGEPQLFVPQRVFRLSPVMIGEHRRFVQHSSTLSRPDNARRASGGNDSDDEKSNEAAACQRRPPVQQIQVFNRGESAFRLEVGSNAFLKVNAENYGYPVLRCATSSEIVPANSSVFLDIEFNPVEPKRVEASLILKAHGLMGRGYKEAVMITIVATGYHPRLLTLAQALSLSTTSASSETGVSSEPPKKQLVAVPDQPACFVSDFVDFGHVPMYSQVNQLVVLQNEIKDTNSSLVAVFEWDATHPLVVSGTLQFSPKSGELAPGEKAIVRVIVQALGDAVVVNHDVACYITYRPDQSSASTSSPSRTASRSNRTSNEGAEPKPRESVITRSTATQEAAGDPRVRTLQLLSRTTASSSTATIGGKPTRKPLDGTVLDGKTQLPPPNNAKSVRYDDRESGLDVHATPLFVRVYAHVLPQDVFEKTYSRDELKRMPVPVLTAQMPLSIPSTASRDSVRTPLTPLSTGATARTDRAGAQPRTPLAAGSSRQNWSAALGNSNAPANLTAQSAAVKAGMSARTQAEKAACRDVLYDVLEALAVDVMNTAVVQEALERQMQPLPAPLRALAFAATPTLTSTSYSDSRERSTQNTPLFPHARKSEDCQAILASVMENTVFNILQELFHGDLEQELLCVPRKSVFPSASSPKSKQLLRA